MPPTASLPVLLLVTAVPALAQTHARMGIPAPDGSTWMREAHAWGRELGEMTAGRVNIRFIGNGIAGEDRELVARMRSGQLDLAGITSVGMRELVPEVSLLLLPEVVRSWEDVDRLRQRIRPIIERRLAAQGLSLVLVTDVGRQLWWTARRAATLKELQHTHFWLWNDDPVNSGVARELAMAPLHGALFELRSVLAEGKADGVFGTPPLAILAFQAHPHLRYAVDLPLGYLTAWVIVRSDWIARLPEDVRRAFRMSAEKFQTRLHGVVRSEDARALELLGQRGIEIVRPQPAALRELEDALVRARDAVCARMCGNLDWKALLPAR